MKKTIFISDFDGTISNEDFYRLMMDKYVPGSEEKYDLWREEKIKDIDFLGYVFENINQEQNIIDEEARNISIDLSLKDFVEFIRKNNGEFVILSAGSKYYIDLVLEKVGVDVKVYSNLSEYKDKGLYYNLDKEHEFYSERYGIDKKKVTESLIKDYDLSFYAGDSMPDYQASLLTNMVFSKAKLTEELNNNKIDNVPFKTFEDVKEYLIKEHNFIK